MKKARQTTSLPTWQKRGSISKQSSGKSDGTVESHSALQEELERASAGLVYSSESDRPFEFFSFRYAGRSSPPQPADFAKLAGAKDAAPAEQRSLADFFARHTATSDPYDSEAQKIRPRYEALMRVLSTRLRDARVYRLGKIEIQCYIAGLDGAGNLAGLKTVAIET